MPKLSNQDFAKALEEHDRRGFKEQVKLWLRHRVNPPDCPECDFEDGFYCDEHEPLVSEVLNEEFPISEFDEFLKNFFKKS